ncbi:acyltransferase family protein [Dokdonella sp.]|uniref:acyltransferase family protein n=1 Tax=Dokdonella sp. TaxID=2291710 RepID=UPI00352908DA
MRAIAALLVVWMHVSESFYTLSPQTGASRWLFDISHQWDFGRIGVVAFFVISGFVIPFSTRPGVPGAGLDFAIKRLFRIYPAYWLSIPAGAFACHWLWGKAFTTTDFLVNLTLMQDLAGVPPAIGLYWTLLVELAFYAICLVFLVTGNIRNYSRIAAFSGGLALIVLVWLIAQGQGHTLFFYGITLWLVHLSIMSMATLFRAWYDRELKDPAARITFYALVLFYLVGYPLVSTLIAGLPWGYTVPYSIGIGIVLLGATVLRIRNPLMTWLGQISYSIYLFHPVVFYTTLSILYRLPVDSWWRTRHLSVYLGVITMITICIAAAVYDFVEKPCIRLGRRLADRVTRDRVGLAAVCE